MERDKPIKAMSENSKQPSAPEGACAAVSLPGLMQKGLGRDYKSNCAAHMCYRAVID